MLRLNNYLPYLVNRIGPQIQDGFAGPLAEAGITLQMWRVLAVLNEYGDRPVGELSRLTSIRVSTLSRLIDRMARQRLVARRRAEGDARSIIVHMTDAGREKAEFLIPHAESYAEKLSRNFTEAELRTFKHLLVKLYESFEEEAASEAGEGERLAG